MEPRDGAYLFSCPSMNQLYVRNVFRKNVTFEAFTVVTMKNGVFWDDMSCGSCKNQLGISLQHASVASYS
jgi:hypothetical protein